MFVSFLKNVSHYCFMRWGPRNCTSLGTFAQKRAYEKRVLPQDKTTLRDNYCKKKCLKGLERLMLEISYNYYYCYDPQVFFKPKVFKRWMDSLRMVALILQIRDCSTQN